MLPVNCGSHSDYQNFVVKNLRKYYPNPDSIARSTWDIIDRFWNLDLSYTNKKLKNRIKFRCPLASRKYGCSCGHPCSDSKYGRTVHLATKDNPRLINIPPRDSDEWKTEFNARTSAERSNKREKYDFL